MKIIEKIMAKRDMYGQKPVTLAFLGDSVTQGCFECYIKNDGCIETVFDYKSAYSTKVREILNFLYPNVQINIINSGISGDNAANALTRIERDILPFSPDLCVVSFGLNDCCCGGIDGLDAYLQNIRKIIETLNDKGIEVIFLTQNYMNTEVSCHLKEEQLRNFAANSMKKQNDGVLQKYMEGAAKTASECGAVVCDLHTVWQKMAAAGIDTTELLANKLNHPVREMHKYMAIKLVETMLGI